MTKKKRAIYINVSIISIMCWSMINKSIDAVGPYDYPFAVAMDLLVLGLVFRLREAFFAREAGISKRSRTYLIIFIVLNYICIIGYVIAKVLHWHVGDYLIYGVIILYLILMGIYLEAVLKYE